ncbi:MAG: T9SS type A sorting domain-containing protein [Chloroflexota bacterium]|nr:T9SS type A sorting domain-containing protein [Lentimicrobium sp.]
MKRIATIIFSLFFLTSIAQNNIPGSGSNFAIREYPEYVTDSIYNFIWNETTQAWDLTGKTSDMSYNEYRLTSEIEYDRTGSDWQRAMFHTYTYNAQGKLVTELMMSYADSVWENNYMVNQTWDAAGNMTQQDILLWNGLSWMEQQRFVMTYDASNNMLTWLLQTNNGSWVNYNKKTFTYTSNRLTEEITERWQDPSWVNFTRKQYAYENNQLSAMVEQSWSNNAWANDVRSAYSYDNSGNLVTTLVQALDNGNWINRFNNIYTYTNNRLMHWLFQNWDGNAWIDSQQEIHNYDNGGNHTYCLNQITKGDTWKDLSLDLWNYNSNNNLTQTSHKIFDAENVYGDSTSYFLRSVLGMEEKTDEGFAVYPNPTTGKVVIQSDQMPSGIEIYTLSGNVVITPEAGRIIDMSDLPAGTYIIRATFGKKITSKVVIRL